MKNINKNSLGFLLGGFVVGTLMGWFLIKLTLILAVLGIIGYGVYSMHKNGVFSK